MESNKKILLTTIFIAIVIVLVTGITFAFFNYTRTGLANRISVGRIYFNTSQDGNINLTNVFPIASSEATGENTNYDSIEITITGDTTYEKGVEYLITFVDVNNTVISGSTEKQLPITFNVEATDVGESNDNYFNARGLTTSMYYLNEEGNVEEDKYIIVGYIAPGQSGIDGSIEIKAYIDADKIAISDTYDETSPETDNMGTSSDWVNGRTVFTTNEWNSFQGNNSLSFKIKVEANEGIWVEKETTPESCFTYERINNIYAINPEMNINTCVTYLSNNSYSMYLKDGESLETFCSGTGTLNYMKLVEWADGIIRYDSLYFDYDTINYLLGNNIIMEIPTVEIVDYDENCGSDVIIPEKLVYVDGYVYNTSRNNTDITNCVNLLEDWWGPESDVSDPQNDIWSTVEEGETYYDFCAGTGTNFGDTLQDWLDYDSFDDSDLEDLESINIIRMGKVKKNYSISKISTNAFYGKGLTSIVIPNSIKTVEDNAFDSNDELEKIVIDMSVIPESFSNNKNISSIKTLILGNNVQVIKDYAFEYIQLSNLMLGNSIKRIDQYAFYTNQIEGAVTIPNSVTFLGQYAFYDNQIETLMIPNSVKNISSFVFGSNKLTSVSIGNGFEHIAPSAFYKDETSNPNLASIAVDKSCSVIKNMIGYAWIGDSYKAGTTIYGSNNEVCDAFQ